jgi:hypothetical protein
MDGSCIGWIAVYQKKKKKKKKKNYVLRFIDTNNQKNISSALIRRMVLVAW